MASETPAAVGAAADNVISADGEETRLRKFNIN